MPVRLLILAAVAAAAFALGYLSGRPPAHAVVLDLRHTPSPSGKVVARFAGDVITADELRSRLLQMSPTARARYQTVAQRQEYVEGLLRFELLAHEARARGLAEDADVRETAKKVMVQRLLQQELDENPPPPTEEELAAYYERHKADYVRPERLRLSHLFLAAPRADRARAEARRREAEALLEEVQRSAPQDFRSFGALVVKHTDDLRTRPLEGDLRFLSLEELAALHGPEVAEAAAALETLGATSPVVQTEKGLHILKLRSRDPALKLDLAAARPQLLSRVSYERRTRRYEALLASLEKKWEAKVEVAAVAEVEVDPSAPAVPAAGPPPGFIPAPGRATQPPPTPQPPSQVVPGSGAGSRTVTPQPPQALGAEGTP